MRLSAKAGAFEIERALNAGEIEAEDFPALWDSKCRTIWLPAGAVDATGQTHLDWYGGAFLVFSPYAFRVRCAAVAVVSCAAQQVTLKLSPAPATGH